MGVAGSHITRGQEMTNKTELARTRYEVVTIDRGYHVYMAVWEAAVGQMLPCGREGGNIHHPYPYAVVKNDTPIDNDTPVLNGKFHG